MRRLTTKIATLASTGLVAGLLGAVTLAAPAQAAAPVVGPDKLTIYANTLQMPDLLANDSDPDGDVLEICRIKEVLDGPVLFAEFLGFPIIAAEPGTSGTFTFTYYACDFETLVPGTVTVTVKPSPKMNLKVTKIKNRPGKVRVVNKNPFAIDFAWGHAREDEADKEIRVAKGRTRVITVRRSAITWLAVNGNNGSEKLGYLKGIKLPQGKKKLPPSPRPRTDAQAPLLDSLQSKHWLAAGHTLR